jgi:hypothetical protein
MTPLNTKYRGAKLQTINTKDIMNIRLCGLILSLVFGLISTVNAQILLLGGTDDLNQLRLERNPGLSPVYSDSDPLEEFDVKWSNPSQAIFFIGGNTDPEGMGITLQISDTKNRPLTTISYDTGWSSSSSVALWISVPPLYGGDFGNMALEPWMRNSLVTIHEIEFSEKTVNGFTALTLDRFSADLTIGRPGIDAEWMRGEIRYQSSFPVNIGVSAIPEPQTYGLAFGVGMIGFGLVRRGKFNRR